MRIGFICRSIEDCCSWHVFHGYFASITEPEDLMWVDVGNAHKLMSEATLMYIHDAVSKGLGLAQSMGHIKGADDFWFTEEQELEAPIRDRCAEGTPTNKPEYLSDMEIRAAAEMIRRESGHVEFDEMVRSISRLVGFKRAGPEFRARVEQALYS